MAEGLIRGTKVRIMSGIYAKMTGTMIAIPMERRLTNRARCAWGMG